MLIRDIFIIIGMLLGSALFGYFIGWFRKHHKIEEMQEYIAALEDKNNRLQTTFKENEKNLIDCQTEKKKIEKELNDYQVKKIKKGDSAKKETKKKAKKEIESKKTKAKADNLKKIEGIGPKIAGILKDAGLETYEKLSKEKPEKISDILVKTGGNAYNRFDPTTWPDQAKMAAEGKWNELKKWQDELKGGKS